MTVGELRAKLDGVTDETPVAIDWNGLKRGYACLRGVYVKKTFSHGFVLSSGVDGLKDKSIELVRAVVID